MTWSLLAREPGGRFGVAIASRFFAVGALSTQALMNPTYGPAGMSLERFQPFVACLAGRHDPTGELDRVRLEARIAAFQAAHPRRSEPR